MWRIQPRSFDLNKLVSDYTLSSVSLNIAPFLCLQLSMSWYSSTLFLVTQITTQIMTMMQLTITSNISTFLTRRIHDYIVHYKILIKHFQNEDSFPIVYLQFGITSITVSHIHKHQQLRNSIICTTFCSTL